jgi:hypothetical protein
MGANQDQLREWLEQLEQIHRPSASEGERQSAFYHWPNDVAANVEFDTVGDGIRFSGAAIRRLDQRWP